MLPAMTTPYVIIVSRNSRSHLPACLSSVARFLPAAPVTVVDNASTDGTLDVAGRAEVIRLPRNVGYARAANLGAARAPDGPLLFLNPDAELLDEVGPALDLLSAPGVGAVTLSLISRGGGPQRGTRRRFHSVARVIAEQAGLRALGTSPRRLAAPDWVPGAALLIRRAAWRQVGAFDEGFPFYGEDADWCLRARRLGWRVAVAEDVRARHVERASVGELAAPGVAFAHRATLGLLRKHGPAGSLPAAWLAMVLGSALRSALAAAAAPFRPGAASRARDYAAATLHLLGFRGLPGFPPDDPTARSARIWMVDPLGRGGITQYTHLLLEAMDELGARPALFTSTRFEFAAEAGYPFVTAFAFPRVDTATRRRRSLPARTVAYARGLGSIARDARSHRPEVVHLQGTLVPWLERRFARRLRRQGTRVAVTLHTTFEHRGGALDALVAEADAAFALTQESVDRAGAGGVRLVGHGPYDRMPRDPGLGPAEARRALGVAPHAEVVLFFGQVRAYKGFADLVEAFAEVAAHRTAAELHVLARPHGPIEGHLTRLQRLGLSGRTRVRLGFFPLEELITSVRAADVVALPDRQADQSGAVVLALGQGVPVVATRVGAIPEVVRDGESGLLVEPGDRAALTERLERVLGDPDLRDRLRGGARAASDRLPRWTDVAEQTLAAYGRLATPAP